MIGHKNVALKPIEEEHVSLLVKWGNARGLLRNRSTKRKTCTTEQKEIVNNSGDNPDFLSFMVLHSSAPKGVCEVYDLDWINRGCKINLYLEDRAESVPACGDSALLAILDFIYDSLGMHKATVDLLADDVVMAGLYKKHGFKAEVRRRQHYFTNGQYKTVIEMSLLEEEFEALR